MGLDMRLLFNDTH